MLVQELVNMVNNGVETYDEYTFDVMKQFINFSMDEMSLELGAAGDQEFITTVMIPSGLPVPSDFVQFIPKTGYPVERQGDVFISLNGGSPKCKYIKSKPWVNDVTDTVPFPQHCIGVLVDKIKSRLHADKTLKYVVENPQVDQYIEQRGKAALLKAKGG